MRRFLRLSLTQLLLLVALVALVTSIITLVRSRFGVMYNDPSLAVSPDGKALASGHAARPLFGRQHPVWIRKLAEPHAPAATYEAHRWPVADVAYTPDGKSLYSVGDRSLRQWDARTGVQLGRIDTTHAANCLAVSADGQLAATGGASEVKVWNLASHREVATLTGHSKLVWNVVFSPDGRYLVSSGMDGTCRVWNAQTWRLSSTLPASGPTDIAFTRDGRLVVSGYESPTKEKSGGVEVTIVEIPSGKTQEVFHVQPSWAAVSAVAVSRDGKLLAAAHGGDRALAHSAISIWDLEKKEKLATRNIAQHGDQWIDELEFSTDGETLFCASQNNVVTAQRWRAGRSSVLFASSRVFPWSLAGGGGLVWLAAWYVIGRPRKSPAATGKTDDSSSASLLTGGTRRNS